MPVPLFAEPTTKAQVVFQQSLNVFFQCGHCSKLLLDQVPFATLADGSLADLRCPRCSRVWSFSRHPVITARDPGPVNLLDEPERVAKALHTRLR